MTSSRRKPRQLSLDRARTPTGLGGWRPGAGRPRGRTTASHARRDAFSSAPLHVTLRIAAGVRSLRNERAVRIVRDVIAVVHRDDFRVVEFNVLGNHVHLLVEASDQHALARGMQRLGIRLARNLNALLGRRGALFAERYHARALRSPREVRNVVRYVLLNARHHAAERGERLARTWIDPFSSAPWFDGWRAPVCHDADWLRALLRAPCPTAPPRTWLLRVGWRRHGLLAFDDVPADRMRRRRDQDHGGTPVTVDRLAPSSTLDECRAPGWR